MDKLKTMLPSKEKGDSDASNIPGPTGRVTGQGSHFPQREGVAENITGSLEHPASGYVQGADAKQASETAHSTESAATEAGTAAIAKPSTYSTHVLRKGDAVGSVVDSKSNDPTTYQMPEHSYGSNTGVPTGAAGAAAALAFHKGRDHSTSNIPGAFPKDEPSTESTQAASAATAGSAGLGTGTAATGASTLPSAHDSTTVPSSTLTSTASPADESATYSQLEKTRVPDTTTPTAADLEPRSTEPQKPGTLAKILGAVGLGAAAGGAGVAASRAGDDDQAHALADTPNEATTTTGTDSYATPTRSGPPPSHHRKESIPTTAYPAGEHSPAPINSPVGGTSSLPQESEQKDHTGRNAGLVAAGIGAGAGVTAFGAHEHDQSKPPREDVTGQPSQATAAQATRFSAVPTDLKQESSDPRRDIGEKPTEVSGADLDRESKGHGKTAAAAGVGAGAGAAGEYAVQGKEQPEASRTEIPVREKDHTTSPATTAPVSERATKRDPTSEKEKDEDHTVRNAALGGAAAAGAGAYGVHEYNEHQAEEQAVKAEAQRQKDLAEQEAARQKQFEKDQKAAEKQAHKEQKQHQKELEKEEKAREKAAAKEEKQHQKELEKEEKAREKAAAKEEQHHQKALEKEEQGREKAATVPVPERQQQLEREEKKRFEAEETEKKQREKEAAAATAGGTAAYAAHDAPSRISTSDESGSNKLHKDPPQEKKPNILKRIFKRRKNKETGQDEDYETDEEEDPHPDHLTGAGAVGGATAVAGTGAATQQPSGSTYKAEGGGLQKPSYNPFSKDDPRATSTETPIADSLAQERATHTGATAGTQHSLDHATASSHNHSYESTSATSPTSASRTDIGHHTSGSPDDPTHEPEGPKRLVSQDVDPNQMGGLAPRYEHGEGEENPGLGHRIIDALKPLPEPEREKKTESGRTGEVGGEH